MGGVDPGLLRDDLAALYPQFGVTVAHAGLVLAPPTDVELLELAAIVGEPGGIVEPGREPELLGWPAEQGAVAARRFLEHAWRLREVPTASRWRMPLTVIEGGRALGQVVLAHEYDDPTGTVRTSSWLARAEQGRGLGRRVRLMVLELAFSTSGRSGPSPVPRSATRPRCGSVPAWATGRRTARPARTAASSKSTSPSPRACGVGGGSTTSSSTGSRRSSRRSGRIDQASVIVPVTEAGRPAVPALTESSSSPDPPS